VGVARLEVRMIGLLLILVLLALLFGGLGVFVARAFLFALLAVLVVGLVTGGGLMRGRR
jgi:hypothetical protein